MNKTLIFFEINSLPSTDSFQWIFYLSKLPWNYFVELHHNIFYVNLILESMFWDQFSVWKTTTRYEFPWGSLLCIVFTFIFAMRWNLLILVSNSQRQFGEKLQFMFFASRLFTFILFYLHFFLFYFITAISRGPFTTNSGETGTPPPPYHHNSLVFVNCSV